MTWQREQRESDDQPARAGAWGRPGGDWAGVRPTIDNPLTWSLPVLRVAGVTVRVHLLFLAYVVVKLSRAMVPAQGEVLDFKVMAAAMGVLLVVVLAHELGHVLGCRLARGHADEIIMWPLGGLAFCHPPHRWEAHLATAVGGPLVNVAIILLASPLLMAITGDWRVAIPDPLNPLDYLQDPVLRKSWAHIILYMLNAWSMTLLAFNLLPMFPLDGGRITQAVFWSHSGWSASMHTAVRFGLVTGLALAIYGGVILNWPAVAVAAFGLVACYMTERQLRFSDSVLDLEIDEDQPAAFSDNGARDEATAEDESALATHGPTISSGVSTATEIDRILHKIAQQGIDSLTQQEQDLLHAETERKRREG